MSMAHIENLFGKRTDSKGLFPPCRWLPELTSLDFLLWSFLKDIVHGTNSKTLNDLKANISATTLYIDQ